MFLVAALLGSKVEPYSATHPAVYAGTYAVSICHGSCAGRSVRPFRTGTIVLFDGPLQNQHGHTFLSELDRDPVNACFVLNHTALSGDKDTFVPAHGFFSWAVLEGTVELELVRSADAGYGVNLHLTPTGLGGTGAFWASIPAAPDSPRVPPDVISAVRIGEPDIAKCPPLSDENR